MKKSIIMILAIAMVGMATAQRHTYPTDTINGVPAFTYKVQKSEGLYRIAKNFGVTQEAIIALNPKLETQGLWVGDNIYIPYVVRIDSSKYVTHTIQPKETLYGLSKKYNVGVEDIVRLNPETADRMAIGTTLLICKKQDGNEGNIAERGYVSSHEDGERGGHDGHIDTGHGEHSSHPEHPHHTGEGDGMHHHPASVVVVDSARGVASQLVYSDDENPLLMDEKDEAAVVDSVKEVVVEKVDSALVQLPFTASVSALPLRIAYLLPFMTSEATRDNTKNRFVEFYEGALMAINEAQKWGQHFEILTYDVEKTDVAVLDIIGKPEMQTMDAIIGPAYSSQVDAIYMFAQENRIPTFLPFVQNVKELEKNPYLFQFNSSDERETEAIVHYLKQNAAKYHCVFVEGNGKEGTEQYSRLKKQTEQIGVSSNVISVHAVLSDSLKYSLMSNKENLIVVPSRRYQNLQSLLPHLQSLQADYSIRLLAQYSWTKERTQVPMLYASVFTGSKAEELEEYERQYKEYFSHEHGSVVPRYDLLGYDLTRYVIQLLQSKENGIDKAAQIVNYKGLQSNIVFKASVENGGYRNTEIQIQSK